MWIPETELKWLGLEASPFICCALSPAQLELLREHLPSDSKNYCLWRSLTKTLRIRYIDRVFKCLWSSVKFTKLYLKTQGHGQQN